MTRLRPWAASRSCCASTRATPTVRASTSTMRTAKLGLVDMGGNLLYKCSLGPRGLDVPGLLSDLPGLIRQAIRDAKLPPEKLGGLGVGVPGVVSPDQRSIRFAPLIGIDEELPCGQLLDSLKQELHIPVVMENEVNAAAWGAFVHLADGAQDMLYCTVGTGLGAGIVLDGQLWRGRGSLAGELGYTSFSEDWQTIPTQPGWMEARISLEAVQKQLNLMAGNGFTDAQLAALANRVARPLSLALANFQHMMDLDVLVVGGSTMRKLGEPFLDAIRSCLDFYCLRAPEVLAVEVRNPGLVGLASLAQAQMLEVLLTEDEPVPAL